MYDLVIKNGLIIDGTGMPAYKSDVGIKDGCIKSIEPNINSESKKLIDAEGKYVTPGFIDMHRHADTNAFNENFGEIETRQGVTTIINGNCGLSSAPCPYPYQKDFFNYIKPITGELKKGIRFQTFGDYMNQVAKVKLPLNFGCNVGNGTVRIAVKHFDSTSLTKDEIEDARFYIKDALEAGSLGISLGLAYIPECFYSIEEIVEILKPIKNYNVPLVTHIRGEGNLLVPALEEVIEIAKRLDVKLHVSHLKSVGKRNWGHGINSALSLFDTAQKNGMQVSFDVYPYNAGSSQLMQILPPDFLSGGIRKTIERLKDTAKREELKKIFIVPQKKFENQVAAIGWENIVITSLKLSQNMKYIGKSVKEIADINNIEPLEFVCNLLIEEECNVTMVNFIVSDNDVIKILKDSRSAVISDSLYPSSGLPHPRLYGTFPKLLAEYVYKRKILSIEQAIKKITSVPANVYGIKDRGRLYVGAYADVNVFDIAKVSTTATYTDPANLATGFDYVVVNGCISVSKDVFTNTGAGRIVK